MATRLNKLLSLFRNTHWSASSRYHAAVDWSARFSHAGFTPEVARLTLEHARSRLDDRLRGNAILESRLLELLRFDATLLAGIFAFNRLAQLQLSICLVASFVCLLASMLICLRARMAMSGPVRASIRDVLDNIAQAESPETWLACSIHQTVEGMQVTSDLAADRYDAATWLTVVSLALLLPAMFGA